MPPTRGRKAAAPALPPLVWCKIALSGTFPGETQASIKARAEALGATVASSVTADTTHLIATEADYNRPSPKVARAQSLGIPIVSLEWLLLCETSKARAREKDHVPGGSKADAAAAADQGDASKTPSSQPDDKASTARVTRSRKRASPAVDGAADNDEAAPKAKKTRGRKAAAAVTQNGDAADDVEMKDANDVADAEPEEKKVKEEKDEEGKEQKEKEKKAKTTAEPIVGAGQVAKSKDMRIPLDEMCPFVASKVYIDPSGVIYDAALNQTNASNNNNKFYRIQVLVDPQGFYRVWNRWGRVGERGQTQVTMGTLDEVKALFEKKFKDKSGLSWKQRGENPRPGKYVFVERNYNDDSDEEDEAGEGGEAADQEKRDRPPPKCTLHPAIQQLMELIFNPQYFSAAMTSLNYDANKLPLGKLSKATISRGFQTLKDLSALIDDPSLASSTYGTSFPAAVEHLSNTFYSLIPHAFGRNRPPVIRDLQMLKKEVELLESLSDMKAASLIMKPDKGEDDDVHPLDKQYRGLQMREMTPLDPASGEYAQLHEYLLNTRGATHGHHYEVETIFRIEREGEHDRFNSSVFGKMSQNRRLLWHGSRCTNYGGILGQGLRIAPPEAPATGYMFGKGIYLADMASKSANYCHSHISGGTALLLLCEAELGDPMQELIHANYNAGEDAKAKGMVATWGQGRTGPLKWKDAGCVHPSLAGVKMPDTSVPPGDTKVDGAGLYYNEYICYDVAQVRLRYLFRVKMKYR